MPSGQTDDSTAETARFTLADGRRTRESSISERLRRPRFRKRYGRRSGAGWCGRHADAGRHGGSQLQTAEDGSFAVMELRPGEYSLRVALPEDTLFAENTSLELAHADAQEGQTP